MSDGPARGNSRPPTRPPTRRYLPPIPHIRDRMRPRDAILGNLESIYRSSYDAATAAQQPRRMEELDNAYQRDQLMMEVLLDVRDLLARQPAAPPGQTVLDQLEALRRIAKR